MADHQEFDDVDVEATREYLDWLEEELEADELQELQEEAAGGPTASGRVGLSRVVAELELQNVRDWLEDLGRLSRLDKLRFLTVLARLRREYPGPADEAWREFLGGHPELEQGGEPVAVSKPVDFRAQLFRERQDSYRELRALRAELRLERAANFPPDDAVLAVLREEHEPGASLTAKDLAPRLVRLSSQSTIVRVGQALARLEAEGLVARVVRGDGRRIPNRWAPVEGGHDGR